ncbi:hypothetical protein BT96DRAFT_816969, partial [Gymnopus androsaceus JB14]
IRDSEGIEFKGRYRSFLRMVRQWRHLKELKRGGRGNDDNRKVADTRPGELAVRCIACPVPGINLPEGWENAQKEDRLKRRNAGTWETDPPLCDGGSYFVESDPYRDYCAKMKDQDEICTCTGLAALDYANTKYSKGYTTTGVAMCTCGRHEIVMANGVGDMQKGERYGNVDYVWASAMRHVHILLWILLSYDIICQWFKHLLERIKVLPPLVRLLTVHRIIAFVIPKLHILGHLVKCQDYFNLAYTLGAAMSDMEGIERIWSGSGLLGSSTREMGPGSRQNTIEDYWHHWNWRKNVLQGELFSEYFAKLL